MAASSSLGRSASAAPPLRPAHQHERRALAIRQRRHGVFIDHPLLFQPRQRAETGVAGGVRVQKAGPSRRQRHEPQRVPGRRGVENDVIKVGGGFRLAKQS